MIDLYTFTTPNGRKASIMLEEVGLPYRVQVIDIMRGAQFAPEFLALNPNNKIPVMVDPQGPDGQPITVFESGAILIYLAEKTNSPLWPADPRQRSVALQWLMFQMGGLGPILGQNHHFRRAAPEQIDYAIERFGTETERLYKVLDRRLGEVPFLAGEAVTLADIACYPWIDRHDWHHIDLAAFPNVARWFDALGQREAVQRGMAVPQLER
ncbi:glutathione S-transferase family protein [Roseospirillum parvum]|uniref:GST-like protein n=1 Tax=Roseospirillum parvum TaxID=83401 RepID=A0A1G7U1Y4_9PROT|nr:glutathione S-transferase N-terminal domain-containing protein [Roseospirillum parvum]SDG41602.1 GST-like protein [Roseospirillum parvum]